MRLFGIRTLLLCCCFCAWHAYAQDIVISGTNRVAPGATATYTVTSWVFEPDANTQVDWGVTGGTIISQSVGSCQVQWGSTSGLGTVTVSENRTNIPPGQINPMYSGTLYVQVGSPTISIWPTSMTIDYGSSTIGSFNATVNSIDAPTSTKWQYSQNSLNWTDLSPAQTGSTLTPSNTTAGYYRFVARIAGVDYYQTVSVSFTPLDPGAISLTQQPAYNGAPAIANTPSRGGLCLPSDRTYVWEQSVDGQPWAAIGTGVNYPSSNVITGNTYIRRKVTCNGVTISSNVLYVVPSYTSVDFENLNYVRTIDVHVPGINTWQQADQLSMDSKSQGTTYLDGFGRAIQKVAKGASLYNGAWADLVQPVVYDAAGRVTQKFLPYPSTDNPGKFKSANVLTQQASFVTGKFGEPSGAPTFSSIEYDNSPLNRATKVHAPGQSWSTVSINSDYDFNNVTENVHIWTLAYTATAIPVSSPTAVYATGRLYKSITTDEKGKQVLTYMDLSGNVILKKVQQDDAPAGPHAGWACTYYVYDDFNQLRFTIPAKAVAYLDVNNWNLTQQLVDDLCFVYSYDAKGRALSKKQPGVDRIDVVYDQQDRPVFTQDGKGRNNTNQWQGVLYDGLGRTIATGILPQNISTANLQTYVDGHSGAATITTTNTNLGTPTGPTDLVINSRQAGVTAYVATNSITFNPGFTSESGAQFTAFISGSRIATSNEVVTVTDNSAPSGFITLTQQYYDNYSQSGGGKTYSTADNSLKDPATSSLAMNLPAQPSPQTRGMATISKVKVITNAADLTQGTTWMETDSYYNDQGFVIQVQNDNALGGTDIASSWLDFTGLSWGSCVKHRAGTSSQFTIVSRNVYDRQGKLTDVYKNFNSTFSKYLASYSYDEYGKLKNKTLAPGYTGTGKSSMESLDYSYNIQGWLTGINKDYALNANAGQWDKFFGFYLGFDNRDNQFAASQYNGSITGAIWRSQGDNSMRKYDYTYDNLGRLTSALFNQKKTPTDGWSQSAMNLSEYITYADGNGNIATMKHLGAVPGMAAGTVVDDLVYTYGTPSNRNVNKLSCVHDGATLTGNGQLSDFKDGTNTETTSADYDYDLNGNLTQDLNKGIQAGGVTYNYLNKPVKIVIAGKSMIEYTYDATGAKLTKKVTDLTVTPNTSVTTQYSDEFVYQDGVLQYVLHEDGRMKIITAVTSDRLIRNAGAAGANNVISGKQGVFEYFLKDQLGNTRMLLTEEYQKEMYLATMEVSDPTVKTNEEKVFGKVDVSGNPAADNELALTRIDKPSIWTGNGSSKVTELTASLSTKKVGPNLILKVSAGDVINASAKYFYYTNDASGTTNPVNDALTSLMGALLGNKASPLTKANSTLIQTNLGASGSDFVNFINGHSNVGPTNAPKAFLNVVFFDEQFNFISPDPASSSVGTAVERVTDANNQNAQLLPLSQKAPKNGWVFVYLSNESNQSVYFDNFQVSQEHGRIAEENHYYAFGQKIAGICTKSFNKLPSNSFNYQGDYSEEEENTLWNEFDLRMYDPQIGRWTGADPYDEFASPYVGMGNDPVNSVDEDGGLSLPYLTTTTLVGTIIGGLSDKDNFWRGAAIGAASGLAVGVVSNMLLNYYTDYADPNGKNGSMDRFKKYDYERYEVRVPFSKEAVPPVWYYRSFDAWVNDQLKDLFSSNWHFLGQITNSKFSWITIDKITSNLINQKSYTTRDEFFFYSRIIYSPKFIERNYNFTGEGKRMQIKVTRRMGDATVDISDNDKLKETLKKGGHNVSNKYKVHNHNFRVRYNTGMKDEFEAWPVNEGEDPAVTVKPPVIININLKVKNNRVY